uniref:Uncharacterized protein n=1 Tax=Anatid alphaherpesvirus 2 TaxID=3080522 RepID=A0AAU0K752_9ALPH
MSDPSPDRPPIRPVRPSYPRAAHRPEVPGRPVCDDGPGGRRLLGDRLTPPAGETMIRQHHTLQRWDWPNSGGIFPPGMARMIKTDGAPGAERFRPRRPYPPPASDGRPNTHLAREPASFELPEGSKYYEGEVSLLPAIHPIHPDPHLR